MLCLFLGDHADLLDGLVAEAAPILCGLALGESVGPRRGIDVGGLYDLALVSKDRNESLHPVILQLAMLLGK